MLIENGADVYAENIEGKTPFDIANGKGITKFKSASKNIPNTITFLLNYLDNSEALIELLIKDTAKK